MLPRRQRLALLRESSDRIEQYPNSVQPASRRAALSVMACSQQLSFHPSSGCRLVRHALELGVLAVVKVKDKKDNGITFPTGHISKRVKRGDISNEL